MTEATGKSARKPFGIAAFAGRWLAAIALVLATYNPSGHSFVHWLMRGLGNSELGALHFFTGAVLVAGWAVFVVATNRSLGSTGMVIGALLIGTAIWLLAEAGLVHADTATAVMWLALVALATLLAIGLSWSHVWRRLSGQLEVDDD
jgi:hypothetical protein